MKVFHRNSVAEEVLRQARCPVLTIGPNVPPVNDGKVKFGTILIATDSGPAADRALAYALFLAEDCQPGLSLCTWYPRCRFSEMGPGAYCLGVYATKELTEWQATATEKSERRLRRLVPLAATLTSQPTYVVNGFPARRGPGNSFGA